MEQNKSSAPWLRPPNTLCNTDGRRRTRKSTSKITVRSAKKQERLKKHGTQNQSATGFDLETPSLPSLLTQGMTLAPLCRLTGLSHLLTYLTLLIPPGGQRLLKPIGDLLTCQVRSVWGRVWRSREACASVFTLSLLSTCGSQRDVNTDKMSWLLSWLQ